MLEGECRNGSVTRNGRQRESSARAATLVCFLSSGAGQGTRGGPGSHPKAGSSSVLQHHLHDTWVMLLDFSLHLAAWSRTALALACQIVVPPAHGVNISSSTQILFCNVFALHL